jgi:zinc protease
MRFITSAIKKLTAPLMISAAMIASLSPVAAQQGAAPQDKGVSRSKVERKNLAPVSKDVLRVKLPKPQEVTLDNGLSVLILEDHRFPVATVQLQISGAGPVFEPADRAGIANITAQMLREGTRTHSSRQLAEEIDKLGATLNANSNFGSTAVFLNASGLSDNLDQWLALMGDVLMNPSFPADELSKLKQRLKTQMIQQRSQPGFLAIERFNQAIYGKHPASIVAPSPAFIEAVTPQMLAEWHQMRYVPQNAILGIAGDVSASELIPKLKKVFGTWKKTDYKEALPPSATPATARKIFLIDRPGSVQSTVRMGNIAIDRRHSDYLPLVVMNSVVGGGASARLFLNLREEKGYTYGVYSNFVAVRYPGPWSAGGDVRTEVTEGAMTEFLHELRRIREEPVPAAELEEQKRAQVASFALSLESPGDLLTYAITRKLYDLPADYWETYPTRIMAVTATDVQRVARTYVDPDKHQVVVVGDASKIRPILEKFGTVEVYNTEGRPVVVSTTPQE